MTGVQTCALPISNHLDVKTKDVFQNALINYHGTVAIVSHDRYFLDHLVNKVFELKDGTIHYYSGNYSYFIEKRNQAQIAQDVEQKSGPEKTPFYKNKEKKRLEAEERNKTYKIRAAFEKDLSAVEKKIAALERTKSEHETALCDPQTHKDCARVKTISLELKNINEELEKLYSVWTELHVKLEQASSSQI